MTSEPTLAVIETHPIQYHAPVYRALQQRYGVPVTAIYGSDFSVAGYRDQEFGATFAWDTDLLAGYESLFIDRVSTGGARSVEEASSRGMGMLLRRSAPTAVLLVGYALPFHRQAFLQARRSGCPILFRGETTDHARSRSHLKSTMRDRALRWFYGRCSRLLYVGQRSRDHYVRLNCPQAKLIFSPYCVSTEPFECGEAARRRLRVSTRADLGIRPDARVLLFSGKLSPRKGPDLLLEAVKKLPTAIRDQVVVLFAGDGELRPSLEAQSHVSPSVAARFLGFQHQRELSQYFHAADLLVLPSLHSETWGLVVNEALHHGLPAVVSRGVGCAPDLIEPGATGEICETGSAASLAECLQRGLVLTGGEELRVRCRARIETYTVEKAAQGIATAFESVNAARRAVRCRT